MNDEILSDIEIEQAVRQSFHHPLEIEHVVLREAPAGPAIRATVFMSDKRRLYAYVESETDLLLADVKKTVARMNLVAATYVPPNGQPDYFDQIGRAEFSRVFPGRRPAAPDDLAYYRTLAPYNPALVEIARVKDGLINAYDVHTKTWRTAAEFSYAKISASSV